MLKRILLSSLALVLFAPLHAMAQGACYPAGVVLLDTGRPANGASVRVCTSGSTGTPCTPAASLFTDPTLGTPLGGSPTVTTDAHGNFGFCAAAGANYDLQISGTGITPLTIKNLPLPPTTPIVAGSLSSSSANPANVGQIKLATGDCLDWRNNANTGNIQLCKDTSDALDLTAFSAVKAAAVVGTNVGGGPAAPIRAQAAANAFMSYENTSGALDQKWWDFGASGTAFVGRVVNDANSGSASWITVNRGAGATVGSIVLGSGGGAQTLPTTTDTLVGKATTDTLTNKTLTSPAFTGTETGMSITAPAMTSPTINTGISQGSGHKHQRFGVTCSTGTTAGAQCTTAYTWTSAFADANYTVSITCISAVTQAPSISAETVTASGFTVRVEAPAAAGAGTACGGINAFADHD
jgi:hypothetical protein